MNITSIISSALSFAAGFEWFETGQYSEDGEQVIGEHHFVEARDSQGRKWRRHVANYSPASSFFDVSDDTPYPINLEPTHEQCARNAEELADRLMNNPEPDLDNEVWDWQGHAYGSELWDQNDELKLMDEDELTAYWSRQ